MKRRLILCLGIIALSTVIGIAQSKKSIEIGKNVPDLSINEIVNFRTTSAKISDFSGKLIILDFWATWCSPCVAALPKLAELQERFRKDVIILPVTREDRQTVMFFFEKLKKIKNISPPSVVNDRILDSLFGHVELPHCVWIDKAGKIVGITNGDQVTEKNIQKLVAGEPVSLPPKKEIVSNKIVFQPGTPVFVTSNFIRTDSGFKLREASQSSVVLSSTMTGFTPGLNSFCSFHDTTLITITNYTIKGLYSTALWHNGFETVNSAKTVVEVADSTLRNKIVGDKVKDWGVWKLDNIYCYELKVPPLMADQLFDIMLVDLNRCFGASLGIEGVMEKRKQKYLALIRTSTTDNLATKGGKWSVKSNKLYIKHTNVYLREFLVDLRQPLQQYPFIEDETNYTGHVDIEITCNLSDLAALNKELEKYGLKLVEKEKLADIAVIRRKK